MSTYLGRDWTRNVNINYTPLNVPFVVVLGISCIAFVSIGWLLGPPEDPKPKKQRPQNHNENGMPDEDREEQYLGNMLGQMTQHLTQHRIEEAEDMGKKALMFVERTWGKNSSQYGLVLIPLSRVYEAKGANCFPQVESCLLVAVEILKKDTTLIDYLILVYEKLTSLYSANNKHREAEQWALLWYEYRKQSLQDSAMARTNQQQEIELFCSAATSTAVTLSNLGKFKKSEEIYTEALNIMCKDYVTSDRTWGTLELYTNCLHQQGKTLLAIDKLEDYLTLVKKSKKENEKSSVHIKVLLRKATLAFTIDKFTQTENFLNETITFCHSKNLPPAIAILQDLASCYWELGKDMKARDVQESIKKLTILPHNPLLQNFHCARSKYFYTLEAHIISDEYRISIRVNRTLPKRKEAEELAELPEQIPRKLEKGFMEIFFENPENPHVPIKITRPFDKFQFSLQSPKLQKVENDKWYEICIDIYEDETKANKLGTHHQMVHV